MATELKRETAFWLALWLLPGLGPRKIQTLWQHFKDIEGLRQADPKELIRCKGISRELSFQIPRALELPGFHEEVDRIQQLSLKITDFTQADYPPLLREITDIPPVLYQKGEFDLSQGTAIAFVGARKASFAGKSFCRRLIQNIAKLLPDAVIVSGLALGIDTVAHQAALESGLKTIAVLGNGLSKIYPSQNRQLAQTILEQGAVISEFPIQTQPVAGNFPLRNRIISGISQGCVVIEAGERSGALITAGYALEQNRELFAIPGPPDSAYYRGTNRLIQKGHAKLVMEVEDILEELLPKVPNCTQVPSLAAKDQPSHQLHLTADETSVLAILERGELPQDLLVQKLSLPLPRLLAALTTLEMKEAVVCKPGAIYQKILPV